MTPRFAASAPGPAQLVLWHALSSKDVFEGLSSEADVRAPQSLSTPSCRAFSGAFVGSGRGRGVVTATGAGTALGEINALIQGPAGKIWPVSAGLLELTPLTAPEWILCAAAGSTVLIIVEAEKAVRRWSHRAGTLRREGPLP